LKVMAMEQQHGNGRVGARRKFIKIQIEMQLCAVNEHGNEIGQAIPRAL
jgi:hypothetical protein